MLREQNEGFIVANIVEMVPGMWAIRREISALGELEAMLSHRGQNLEAEALRVIIVRLEIAVGDLVRGRRL